MPITSDLDGRIEWLKDSSTGLLLGYRDERGIDRSLHGEALPWGITPSPVRGGGWLTHDIEALVIGNSFVPAGAVTADNRNYPNGYTNRDVVYLWNAYMGRPWRRIHLQGLSGDNSVGIVNRLRTEVLSGNLVFQDIILFGLGHNDVPQGVGDNTKAKIKEFLDLATLAGKRVFCLLDSIGDGWTGERRRHYHDHIRYLRQLARQYRGVYLVPFGEAFNPKNQNVTSVTTNMTADGLHPVQPGTMDCLPHMTRAVQGLLTPSDTPWATNDDPSLITVNPWMTGQNNNGTNGWFTNTGGSGQGPSNYGIGVTGAGVTIAASKVAHPLYGARWTRGETGGGVTQLVCTSGAGNGGTAAIGIRNHTAKKWVNYQPSGSITGAWNFILPTTPNGCIYKPLNTGNIGTGADPTAGWSTTLGSVFTDGNVQLQVYEDFTAGNRVAFGLADIFFDVASVTGKFTIGLAMNWYRASAPFSALTCSNGSLGGLPNAIGTTASFGTLGGLDQAHTPERLFLTTHYDPNSPIPVVTDDTNSNLTVEMNLTVTLDVSSSVTLKIPQYGGILVPL